MTTHNVVLLTNQTHRLPISLAQIRKFALSVLRKLSYRNSTVSIVLVSDAAIKRLNQRHLRHSYATDVLAFPGHRQFLGEVIISPARARVQAKEFGASFGEELARYVCHGILHLSGYRDKTKPQIKRMRRMENRLLKLRSKKRLL